MEYVLGTKSRCPAFKCRYHLTSSWFNRHLSSTYNAWGTLAGAGNTKMSEIQPAHEAGNLPTSTCGQELQGGESTSDQRYSQTLSILKYQERKYLIHDNLIGLLSLHIDDIPFQEELHDGSTYLPLSFPTVFIMKWWHN